MRLHSERVSPCVFGARLIVALSVVSGSLNATVASGEQDLAESNTESYQALLGRYCVTCHNERLHTGDLSLEDRSLEEVDDYPELWEKVLQKLSTQAMPPPGRPRPNGEAYVAFVDWLEAELDNGALVNPNPGRPTLHRLNRLEYANAVRDMLGLEIDAEALLPSDDLAYGFDNNADILTVSPGLLERYMSAARRVSRLAVGDLRLRLIFHGIQCRFSKDRISE